MAKARTITIEAEDFPQNPPGNPPTSLRTATIPDLPPELIEYDDVTALNNVLAELGADDEGGFVVVHREVVQPNGRREDEWLDRYPVSDFSIEGLKSRWGSGRYKISVYHSGGGGLAARKTIPIAKDPNAVATAVSAPQPQAADLTPILQTMQQGFEKLITVMMQTQSRPEQPSRMEMLQEMQIMSEIFKQPATPAPQVGILEALKLGADMAANGAGGESNNAWVGKIIDQLGPVLMPVVAGAVQNAAAPKPAPAPARIAKPTPAATLPAPTQTNPEENPVNIIVAQYLNMLKRAAEAKAPVDEYADSILASIPQSQVTEIENLLRPDDWREQLREMTNAADLHPEWFGSLRDTLLMYIDEDKGQNEGVTTHLTAGSEAGSVSPHVDDNTGNSANDQGNPSGIA